MDTMPPDRQPEQIGPATDGLVRLYELFCLVTVLTLLSAGLLGWQYYAVAYRQPQPPASSVAAIFFSGQSVIAACCALSLFLNRGLPRVQRARRARTLSIGCAAGSLGLLLFNIGGVLPRLARRDSLPASDTALLALAGHLSLLLLVLWVLLGVAVLVVADRHHALLSKPNDAKPAGRPPRTSWRAVGKAARVTGLVSLSLLVGVLPLFHHIRRVLAVHELAEYCHGMTPEELEVLLDQNDLSVDTEVLPGETLLHRFAADGQPESVKVLIARGATIEGGRDQITPLRSAIMAGRLDNARVLIAAGAEEDLWAAAALGHVERVHTLLAQDPKGAEVAGSDLDGNLSYSRGFSPLFLALRHGHREVVKALIEAGHVPSAGELALAAQENDPALVKLLMERTDSLSASAVEGVLLNAIAAKNWQIARQLLEADIDYSTKSPWRGYGIECSNAEILQALLDKGFAVDDFSLSSAVMNGHADVVEVILRNGGDAAEARRLTEAMNQLEMLPMIRKHEKAAKSKEAPTRP